MSATENLKSNLSGKKKDKRQTKAKVVTIIIEWHLFAPENTEMPVFLAFVGLGA